MLTGDFDEPAACAGGRPELCLTSPSQQYRLSHPWLQAPQPELLSEEQISQLAADAPEEPTRKRSLEGRRIPLEGLFADDDGPDDEVKPPPGFENRRPSKGSTGASAAVERAVPVAMERAASPKPAPGGAVGLRAPTWLSLLAAALEMPSTGCWETAAAELGMSEAHVPALSCLPQIGHPADACTELSPLNAGPPEPVAVSLESSSSTLSAGTTVSSAAASLVSKQLGLDHEQPGTPGAWLRMPGGCVVRLAPSRPPGLLSPTQGTPAPVTSPGHSSAVHETSQEDGKENALAGEPAAAKEAGAKEAPALEAGAQTAAAQDAVGALEAAVAKEAAAGVKEQTGAAGALGGVREPARDTLVKEYREDPHSPSARALAEATAAASRALRTPSPSRKPKSATAACELGGLPLFHTKVSVVVWLLGSWRPPGSPAAQVWPASLVAQSLDCSSAGKLGHPAISSVGPALLSFRWSGQDNQQCHCCW